MGWRKKNIPGLPSSYEKPASSPAFRSTPRPHGSSPHPRRFSAPAHTWPIPLSLDYPIKRFVLVRKDGMGISVSFFPQLPWNAPKNFSLYKSNSLHYIVIWRMIETPQNRDEEEACAGMHTKRTSPAGYSGARARPPCFAGVSAGFPSPADDYREDGLDLNRHLVRHPAATFFVRASGDSMVDAGIRPGDILVVDRSLEPVRNSVVIAVVNGEFTVKHLVRSGKEIVLVPANPAYHSLKISEGMDFEVWGVVTYVIHKV